MTITNVAELELYQNFKRRRIEMICGYATSVNYFLRAMSLQMVFDVTGLKCTTQLYNLKLNLKKEIARQASGTKFASSKSL
jgi:hypothetical protein